MPLVFLRKCVLYLKSLPLFLPGIFFRKFSSSFHQKKTRQISPQMSFFQVIEKEVVLKSQDIGL